MAHIYSALCTLAADNAGGAPPASADSLTIDADHILHDQFSHHTFDESSPVIIPDGPQVKGPFS